MEIQIDTHRIIHNSGHNHTSVIYIYIYIYICAHAIYWSVPLLHTLGFWSCSKWHQPLNRWTSRTLRLHPRSPPRSQVPHQRWAMWCPQLDGWVGNQLGIAFVAVSSGTPFRNSGFPHGFSPWVFPMGFPHGFSPLRSSHQLQMLGARWWRSCSMP